MKPPRIGWTEGEPPGSSDPHERIDLIGAAPRRGLLAIDEAMPRTRQRSAAVREADLSLNPIPGDASQLAMR